MFVTFVTSVTRPVRPIALKAGGDEREARKLRVLPVELTSKVRCGCVVLCVCVVLCAWCFVCVWS